MRYIDRSMEPLIGSIADEFSVILITGPRQVGKSSTCLKSATNLSRLSPWTTSPTASWQPPILQCSSKFIGHP